MAVNVHICKDLLKVFFQGDITTDDLQKHLKELWKIDSYTEITLHRLMDFSEVNPSSFNTDDLRFLANALHSEGLKNDIKAAIIASKPAQYGLARMLMAYSNHPQIEEAVFRDSTSACNWLNGMATTPSRDGAVDRVSR